MWKSPRKKIGGPDVSNDGRGVAMTRSSSSGHEIRRQTAADREKQEFDESRHRRGHSPKRGSRQPSHDRRMKETLDQQIDEFTRSATKAQNAWQGAMDDMKAQEDA